MEGAEVDALRAQISALVTLVNSLSESDFCRATRCPGWTVAELVAHCEGMLIRLVGDHSKVAAGEPEIDRVGYYRYDPDGPREGEDPNKTFSELVRDRAVDEVGDRTTAALGSSLSDAATKAVDAIRQIPGDRVIKLSGRPRIRFREFMATRSLEMGVHTMDVAHAVGRPERVQPAAADIIVAILDGLLAGPLPNSIEWDATIYILAGTGRRELTARERATLDVLAARFPLLR